MFDRRERSSCGVGFVASRTGDRSHAHLQQALRALACVEHRGACSADRVTGDGSGIMADIPFELLGYEPGSVAVATLLVVSDPDRRRRALRIFERTFEFLGVEMLDVRRVPTRPELLGRQAAESRPDILHVILKRPEPIRTDAAFNQYLYLAKQTTRSRLKDIGGFDDLSFASLSTTTIVYKALVRAHDLVRFYPDLTDRRFKTRFCLFHRRFSTNTRTSWDRAQPFRLIAHNGEINTIAGNKSWSYSREQALGLRRDELLTHDNISDTGNLNEQVEALKYRSSIPRVEDILAILIPPAGNTSGYYAFWGRAMEPWDGPAFVTYSDGEVVGARLDRNGFRPCRWAMSDSTFYLSSEAGNFEVDESAITAKGTLYAGRGVAVNLASGEVHFRDPSQSRENVGAVFEPRLYPLPTPPAVADRPPEPAVDFGLHGLTEEEYERMLVPMMRSGKEPIGSMGDTAALAVLSNQRRSLFDYFFQNFAQVTNPPLDYLRERMVTDLSTVLGKRPNIFAPKELIPPTPGFALDAPVLSLEQLASLTSADASADGDLGIVAKTLDCTFPRDLGSDGLPAALDRLAADALDEVRSGAAILVLSDRQSGGQRVPVPSLLALRAVVNALNRWGQRLEASIVLACGDVRTTHHVACCIAFGATAVCPYLGLEVARQSDHDALATVDVATREANLISTLNSGLLKIMSKVGISVVRSYQSSRLFTPVGLGQDLLSRLLPRKESVIGGLTLQRLAEELLARTASDAGATLDALPNTYQLAEKRRGQEGERHAMTAERSKWLHRMVRGDTRKGSAEELYARYLELGEAAEPVTLAHLLDVRPADEPLDLDRVQPIDQILRRFGSGAMSFGSISAESQADIFRAMRSIGGRCNSGEGGENPFYYVDGTCATTKQVASARFGVTAEYLISGDEFEIKIAQGAKPGEGGQLMGVKVDEHIARARHASVGVDLISPPPLHDIYSIEDLKQLIYELRQLKPSASVCVKLVAGANVGTIAVGVAKAGADVIQISGGSGGTGAATLSSMKHAGLPWELGLVEAHQALIEQELRDRVTLRVDGGLHTGRDVVIAALLGAEEFGFGKLLLVAEGCIMARICEQNRCPTGIATHDPRFKAKYKGSPEHVVALLTRLAGEVRQHLAYIGVGSLEEAVGQTHHLTMCHKHETVVRERGLDLGYFLYGSHFSVTSKARVFDREANPLNRRMVVEAMPAIERGEAVTLHYDVRSTDRALFARLSGELARRSHDIRMERIQAGDGPDFAPHELPAGTIRVRLRGSAGQGFGAFLVGGIDVSLRGEANDAVCKSMSGGRVLIRPQPEARFEPETNVIIGNCALYGATGGVLFVHGLAGDRFGVRNSGSQAVVEGVGLHACEYMTSGMVVILGETSDNIGAGMTGGIIYVRANQRAHINDEYLTVTPVDVADDPLLKPLLEDYLNSTGSRTAAALLDDWTWARTQLLRCTPRGNANTRAGEDVDEAHEPTQALH